MSPKAEIIASGTELLLGEVADVNTSFIASQLASLGIDLYHGNIVGDNFERFTQVLRQAWQRADIIITSGGLGPTQGDITREVIARFLGETLTIDPQLREELEGFFRRRGMEMPLNNLKQATIIPSATPLRNSFGTAPGWWVEKENHTIIVLPGPPRELQAMWHDAVLPRLRAMRCAVILSRTLKTWGLAEARVDELAAPFLKSANPTLALYARPDGIHMRITAKAATEAEARRMVQERERDIRTILGRYIWGADEDTLERTVQNLLQARNLTIATAEDFTAGLLVRSFAASHFFRGGLVVPAEDAPSRKTAAMMAEKAREEFRADIGLAICGNPASRGTENACIAISDGRRTMDSTTGYPGDRELIARRTLNHALVWLKEVLEQKNT
ncbi:MAG: CinA family nicotinamide mononucleotide deamidase-related protein [Dehalococcoidales bacterium]|nr:CinA family nicotinamide mononucleotide deamidase-related protein [Dehalococcoidales bacterium]